MMRLKQVKTHLVDNEKRGHNTHLQCIANCKYCKIKHKITLLTELHTRHVHITLHFTHNMHTFHTTSYTTDAHIARHFVRHIHILQTLAEETHEDNTFNEINNKTNTYTAHP